MDEKIETSVVAENGKIHEVETTVKSYSDEEYMNKLTQELNELNEAVSVYQSKIDHYKGLINSSLSRISEIESLLSNKTGIARAISITNLMTEAELK